MIKFIKGFAITNVSLRYTQFLKIERIIDSVKLKQKSILTQHSVSQRTPKLVHFILKKNHEIEKKEKRSKSGNHSYQLHSETKVKSDGHDQNDFTDNSAFKLR